MKALWDWLKANGAAVEGLSALATALATIVLAILTAVYVRLTQGLVGAAEGEARRAEKAASAEQVRRQGVILLLVDRFFRLIDKFPYEEREKDKLPDAIIWYKNDEDLFEKEMVSVGTHSAAVASEILDHMRWIRRYQEKKTDKNLAPWTDYQHHLGMMKVNLGRVSQSLLQDIRET